MAHFQYNLYVYTYLYNYHACMRASAYNRSLVGKTQKHKCWVLRSCTIAQPNPCIQTRAHCCSGMFYLNAALAARRWRSPCSSPSLQQPSQKRYAAKWLGHVRRGVCGADQSDRKVFHMRLPLRRQLEKSDARPFGAIDVDCGQIESSMWVMELSELEGCLRLTTQRNRMRMLRGADEPCDAVDTLFFEFSVFFLLLAESHDWWDIQIVVSKPKRKWWAFRSYHMWSAMTHFFAFSLWWNSWWSVRVWYRPPADITAIGRPAFLCPKLNGWIPPQKCRWAYNA